MEALLEKEADVESWNDERMDELSRRVDAGFEKAATKVELSAIKDEIGLGFDKAGREFARLNDRLDKLLWGVGFVGLTIGLNILADKV
jgi:hypothetical protein